jgi:hypothetical protein
MSDPLGLGPNSPARALVVPHDGRYAIYEILIARPDGGLAALSEALEGPPDSIEPRRLPDVVVFFNEDQQAQQVDWNVRATYLMARDLPVGGSLYGPVVLCGLHPAGGICDLPERITARRLTVALSPPTKGTP